MEIIQKIHPSDNMCVPGREAHYFGVGQSALQWIEVALKASGKHEHEVKKILDLPCGFGRVTRILRARFQNAEITVCDLEREGVDFCAQTFNAIGIYSHTDIAQIPLNDKFDLIWVGSLLTHLNATGCRQFLQFFHDHLNPGGLLIFTLHGRLVAERLQQALQQNCPSYGLSVEQVRKLMEQYHTEGFGYASYQNQEDYFANPTAEVDNYGVSLSAPSWTIAQLEQIPTLALLSYIESGWDHHHDVICCTYHPIPVGIAPERKPDSVAAQRLLQMQSDRISKLRQNLKRSRHRVQRLLSRVQQAEGEVRDIKAGKFWKIKEKIKRMLP